MPTCWTYFLLRNLYATYSGLHMCILILNNWKERQIDRYWTIGRRGRLTDIGRLEGEAGWPILDDWKERQVDRYWTIGRRGRLTDIGRCQLKELVPKYATWLEISQHCIQNLEPAHTIPRLYCRTNWEVCNLVLKFPIFWWCYSSYFLSTLIPYMGLTTALYR